MQEELAPRVGQSGPEEAGHGALRTERTAARASLGEASSGMGGAFEGRVSSGRSFWGEQEWSGRRGVSGAGLCCPWSSYTPAPARRGGSGGAGQLLPRVRCEPVPSNSRSRGGLAAAALLGSKVGLPGAGPGRAGAGRRLARRAAAWARRAMAAPEPAPRRGREREREREDESEDESDILEESPCGRWQKRREQVGTGAGVAAVP